MTKLFAVFGNPILHSKSPQLFNAVFSRSHVDASYTRIRVEKCEDVVRTIKSLNIIGANITTPFKECIIPMLDLLSHEAEQIGAVNTILKDNGVLKGFNTDYLGAVKSIEEAGIDIFGKRCLVIGAGGASRAVVFGLMNSGAEVFIANRTSSKAQSIANQLGCNIAKLDDLDEIIDSIDIVVSTLLPDVSLDNFRWSSNIELLLDANYQKSKLSDDAQNAGIKVVRGDRWLIHQAIGSFIIYTGFEPSLELLSSSINNKLDENQLKIKSVDLNEINLNSNEPFDMLVVTDSLNSDDVKRIVDEEIYKAFKG